MNTSQFKIREQGEMRRAEERGQYRISGARVPWDRSTSSLSVPVKEERERERKGGEGKKKDLGLQSCRTNVRDNTRGRLLPIPWLAFPFFFCDNAASVRRN